MSRVFFYSKPTQLFDDKGQPDGFGPAFPGDCSYLNLCGPHGWGGVYALDEPIDENDACWQLNETHASILESSMRYPPAAAIARHRVERTLSQEVCGAPEQLIEAHVSEVLIELNRQRHAKHIFARVVDDTTDFELGPIHSWHWVLAVSASRGVAWWASPDFFIYEAPIKAFDLSQDDLVRLERTP